MSRQQKRREKVWFPSLFLSAIILMMKRSESESIVVGGMGGTVYVVNNEIRKEFEGVMSRSWKK